MDRIRLSPRLMAVASLASGGRDIIDVGTDHGSVPVWLLQNTQAERVAASDVRPAPLSAARRTAERYGLAARVRFVLADGLEFDGAESADTVILAGMGGETIAEILGRAPWTKRALLAMQPQSKADKLCLWLYRNGYALQTAALCEDTGRLYVILTARGGPAQEPVFAEELLLRAEDALLPRWLSVRINTLGSALEGMERGGAGCSEEARRTLQRLEKVREETLAWPQSEK